ncbi:hypothetical protein [Cellulophaga sp. L1A9]|uniref:hypothetical protein n=1 Tax=Cellulophaga sp. L1A9 TaxID=2686362 RepID=UPI00131BF959|nr:hypothetical protein [Cellulophaga sp. L1A9]
MLDVYHSINAEEVNLNYILLNPTKNRMFTFDTYVLLPLTFVLLLLVSTYNHQGIIQMIFTLILLLTVIILNVYKRKIWHKTVKFNRVKGTIEFKSNFPRYKEIFNFSTIEIRYEDVNIKNGEDGNNYYTRYTLKSPHSTREYDICDTSQDFSFDHFINNYMNSDPSTIDNLILYKKNKDEELKKIFRF